MLFPWLTSYQVITPCSLKNSKRIRTQSGSWNPHHVLRVPVFLLWTNSNRFKNGRARASCPCKLKCREKRTLFADILINHSSSVARNLISEFMCSLQITGHSKFGYRHWGLQDFVTKSTAVTFLRWITWRCIWLTLLFKRKRKNTMQTTVPNGALRILDSTWNKQGGNKQQTNASTILKISSTFLWKVFKVL